jgi:sirohydrochlorin ferrochelatase
LRTRIALCAGLLAVTLPGVSFASQGILLLADQGKPEWNAQLRQLAASVDKQKPTELALWAGTAPDVQDAVDRLIRRGASEIVAVPLFVAAPAPDITSRVSSSVPLRLTAGLNGDQVVADIILKRAREISPNVAADVVVLVSHRASAGGSQRWVPDLRAAAEQLNRARSCAAVVSSALPPDPADATSGEIGFLRAVLERHIAQGRRILVVPVLTPYGGTEAAIAAQLSGIDHDVTTSAWMPDDLLVAWIVSRAEAASPPPVAAIHDLITW